MKFLNPDYIFYMLVPSLILFYLIVTNRSKLEVYFDKKILDKIKYDAGGLGRVGRNIMLFIALFLMIVALARPVKEKGEIKVDVKTIEVLCALDISNSMRAKDLYPDRFEFAKRKLFEFLDDFPEASVGVVAFSSDVFMVSPMTTDKEVIKYLVKNLSFDSVIRGGTDLSLPILISKKFFKDKRKRNRILIIFTDGGDKKDFSKEIEIAKEAGVTVYVYGVGSEKGAPIEVNGKVLKDKNGNIVISKLNDNIRFLSLETGGAYIKGSYNDKDIKLIIDDIKRKFKADVIKNRKIKDYKELFYYPLALGILFLLFAFSSLPSKKGLKGFVFVVFSLSCFYQSPLNATVIDYFDIKRGEEAYKNGDFHKAQYHFERVAEAKKSPESYYDLGNAYYKQKRYKKAIEAYESVITDDKDLNFKRFYNEGNAYFKLKDFDNAVKMYERAKKYGTDEDLIYNLELAKKMKELKKQKQKSRKEGKKESSKRQREKRSSNGGEKNRKRNEKQSVSEKKKREKAAKNGKGKNNKAKEMKETEKRRKNLPITEMEEKKWDRLLSKKRPKTLPLKLKTQKKRDYDEKPW